MHRNYVSNRLGHLGAVPKRGWIGRGSGDPAGEDGKGTDRLGKEKLDVKEAPWILGEL
ncbi:hypothetical protein MPNT_40195 [Candidatus Methylacidithermus pantelleriae]|uniref:Uncharacterized protein n=1 Tax=Candidatus Methylacidithermus pantelleriae TaxID=2744239 RepID=A0A8J2BPL4_9BACT|nr:hypothetical protein MPNT_40195 [Candidatus Methylacidithermus pantelleriae]